MKLKSFKKLLLLTGLMFAGGLFAQEGGTVKGTITDQGIEPILFANVELKDMDVDVQTNFHGNFELNDIPAGEHTLVISYSGYETLEVPLTVIENEVHSIEKSLAAIEFSFDDVEGMEDLFPADETALPLKEGRK